MNTTIAAPPNRSSVVILLLDVVALDPRSELTRLAGPVTVCPFIVAVACGFKAWLRALVRD